MRRLPVDIHQFIDLPEPNRSSPQSSKPIDTSLRNNQIGYEVGIDIFGPIEGKYRLTFRDKASGYGGSYPIANKQAISASVEKIIKHFAQHHHHTPGVMMRRTSNKSYLSYDSSLPLPLTVDHCYGRNNQGYTKTTPKQTTH
jgi:hypothetical protein